MSSDDPVSRKLWTLADRTLQLGEGGFIREWFGATPLDVIERDMLKAWWLDARKRPGRAGKMVGRATPENYLKAVGAVFDCADVANPGVAVQRHLHIPVPELSRDEPGR
jgi:hypothetical protein